MNLTLNMKVFCFRRLTSETKLSSFSASQQILTLSLRSRTQSRKNNRNNIISPSSGGSRFRSWATSSRALSKLTSDIQHVISGEVAPHTILLQLLFYLPVKLQFSLASYRDAFFGFFLFLVYWQRICNTITLCISCGEGGSCTHAALKSVRSCWSLALRLSKLSKFRSPKRRKIAMLSYLSILEARLRQEEMVSSVMARVCAAMVDIFS